MSRKFVYEIAECFNGFLIQNYLKNEHSYSTKLIKSIKKTDNGILKNGLRAFTTHILNTGDILEINIDDKVSENIVPIKQEFGIVYEDEDIMVIDKPPHMPTHPSMDNYTNSLANGIMYYFKEHGIKSAFHAVNRLDKDTSGLLVIAKNPYAHARLSDMLHTPEFVREYICLVHGRVDCMGTVNAPIRRMDDSAILRCVAPDGQRAITHYEPILHCGNCTLLKIILETGRTHQIRVHMAYMGNPLVGDFLYGDEEREFAPRHMLHSSKIRFLHPVTGENLGFEAKMPEDMNKIIEKLKN